MDGHGREIAEAIADHELAARRVELADRLGRMLAVRVEQKHGFGLVLEGRCDPRAQRRALPVPLRHTHELHPRFLRDALELPCDSGLRAVVDDGQAADL